MLRYVLLIVLFDIVTAIGRDQSVAVMGRLLCNGQPASNVKVKLYDDDSGVDLDDLLQEGRTDSMGQFRLSGSTDEFLTIDPKINIYHDCNDGITVARFNHSNNVDFQPCQRRITIYVPGSYVTSGTTPSQAYNAGTIELAGKFSGETRDCFNK